MKRRSLNRRFFVLLVLLFGACSQTEPPGLETETASSHLSAFIDTGGLMTASDVQNGAMRGKSSKSGRAVVVGLFFGGDGQLLDNTQLDFLKEAKKSGKFSTLKSGSELDAYLATKGVKYRLIDLGNYRAVMTELSQENKISLRGFAKFSKRSARIQTRTDLKTGVEYRVFNAYGYIPATAPTSAHTQQVAECDLEKSQIFVAQQPPMDFSSTQLIASIQKPQDDYLQPQQNRNTCLANCGSAAVACGVSCFAAPFPISLICEAACLAFLLGCQSTCR